MKVAAVLAIDDSGHAVCLGVAPSTDAEKLVVLWADEAAPGKAGLSGVVEINLVLPNVLPRRRLQEVSPGASAEEAAAPAAAADPARKGGGLLGRLGLK